MDSKDSEKCETTTRTRILENGNSYPVKYELPYEDAIRNVKWNLKLDLEDHNAIRLPYWGADVIITLQIPDEFSKMTAPYLYTINRFGLVPWIGTQIEIMSNKWENLLLKDYLEAAGLGYDGKPKQ